MGVLAYTGLSGELVMEPGPVAVSADSSSNDIPSTATFTVTGKTRTVRGEDRKSFSVVTSAHREIEEKHALTHDSRDAISPVAMQRRVQIFAAASAVHI
jgi:hypothetical protein